LDLEEIDSVTRLNVFRSSCHQNFNHNVTSRISCILYGLDQQVPAATEHLALSTYLILTASYAVSFDRCKCAVSRT
jgi:hypothetical protein